jgi:hypothetical protein
MLDSATKDRCLPVVSIYLIVKRLSLHCFNETGKRVADLDSHLGKFNEVISNWCSSPRTTGTSVPPVGTVLSVSQTPELRSRETGARIVETMMQIDYGITP